MRLALLIALTTFSLCAYAIAAPLVPITNFSFAHTSDDHNMASAAKTIAEFNSPAPILLKPYNFTALPVSFIIDTGDTTEFGPRNGALNLFKSFYAGVHIPLYTSIGNHDGTWRSLTYELRRQYGAPYYSFDKYGCHFVILDSSGLQDPRPTITPEELVWLKTDLEHAGVDTPVFIALHHPLNVSEFASKYEVDRLMDIIRPYNVVLFLVGHGHSAVHSLFDGIDMVEGGSTYGPSAPGYQVVSVQDGIMRIAYKERGKPDAEKAMVEKPIAPPSKRYPSITIASPKEHSTYKNPLPVKAWIAAGKGEITGAYAEIDGENKIDLTLKSGGSFEGSADLSSLTPGAHYIKVSFQGQDGAIYHHSTAFYIASDHPRVLWRTFLGSASKSTPAANNKMVYVGAYDGYVRAFDRKSGALKWKYATDGAIAGEVLIMGDKVCVGSEDKFLYCLSADKGSLIWKFEAEDPIYSSPVSDGKSIYFGCGTGAFYSVDASTGKQIWKNTDATYNIEIKPFLADGKVIYGAWDCYVHCVNCADGSTAWRCEGKGSSEGTAPIYYSPADCGPVVCNGKVFVADRKFRCTVIDLATGKMVTSIDGPAGTGLSGDGSSVYLRMLEKKLQKVDSDGKVIWSVDMSCDEIPTAPTEAGDAVYVCSKRGLLSAVSAKDGKILWQYQCTPSQYVLAGVGAVDSTAYVAGTDGSLTAISY